MRFNKEEKTRKVFLIDNEEVSEEAFYSSLEDAIINEYVESTFDDYLRYNYCDIEIEGHYYEASDILVTMGDYDNAYEEWLENKTQLIMEDFNNGSCSSAFIYGFEFEIEEIEEAYINIELINEEANTLFIALDPNKSTVNTRISRTLQEFLDNLAELIESEDLKEC